MKSLSLSLVTVFLIIFTPFVFSSGHILFGIAVAVAALIASIVNVILLERERNRR
jgi:hypothetical protein